MARIQVKTGRRDENSGYSRIFGNAELGRLFSMVQAAVIRSGNELEVLIKQSTPSSIVTTPEEVLKRISTQADCEPLTEVVFKWKIPFGDQKYGIADIVVIHHHQHTIQLIELKDGDTFDTKKASGELASLEKMAERLSASTGYSCSIYFCSFNQTSKAAIVAGAKKRFNIEQVMLGRELCNLLQIDYDSLRQARAEHQAHNLKFFLTTLIGIPEIRQTLIETLCGED